MLSHSISKEFFLIWDAIVPANIYLFKVNNSNTRKRYELYSKLTMNTQEWHQWRRSGAFTALTLIIFHTFL